MRAKTPLSSFRKIEALINAVPLYFMIAHALSEHGQSSMLFPLVTAGSRHDLHNLRSSIGSSQASSPCIFDCLASTDSFLNRIHGYYSCSTHFPRTKKVPLRVMVQHDFGIVNTFFKANAVRSYRRTAQSFLLEMYCCLPAFASQASPPSCFYFAGFTAFTSSGVQGILE